MTVPAAQAATLGDPASIARRFVRARLDREALPGFPGGELPASLDDGYAIQDIAIGLWPDRLAGWKVGRVPAEVQARVRAERIAGPIFRRNIWLAGAAATPFPAFAGGFTAVEAEFVYRLGGDAPAGKLDWTPAEAVALAGSLHMGVEIASSPLATINILGPLAVVSDFGNNYGLILGAELAGWRGRSDESLACATEIEGVTVGTGSAAAIAGGPAASLAFVLGLAARRGHPLKAGDLVTTGAATGIHDIEAGQTARISFGEFGDILCVAQADRGGPGGRTSDHDRNDPATP